MPLYVGTRHALRTGRAAAAGTWQTVSDPTLDGEHPGGYNTYTFRVVVAAAEFSTPTTGSKIRITFKAGTSGAWQVSNMYVGHAAAAGDAYDFAATPSELLFSTASGFNLSATTSVTSDELTFAFDATKALIVSFYMVSGTNYYPASDASKTNYSTYNKVANDPTTVDATGYGLTSGSRDCVGIDLIEVFG